MSERTCESYEGCAGRGWIYDSTDSGSGRTCYCDCAAGDRLSIEDGWLGDRPTVKLPRNQLVSTGMIYFDEHGNRVLPLDNSESIHDRSERRADEVTRWDGSERGRR